MEFVLQKMGLKDIEYQSSSLNFSFAEQIVIDATINRQHQVKGPISFCNSQKQSHTSNSSHQKSAMDNRTIGANTVFG